MSLPPSPARPARLAGFILIGVAVVAVGLGVFELTSGGATNSQAGSSVTPTPTTTTQARPTTTTSARPTTTTTTPAPTTTSAAPTTTVAQPPPTTTCGCAPGGTGGGSGSGGQGTGGSGGTSSVMVRVYNNGTIPKLAASAATDFRNAGYNVVETGNYSQEQGVINTTTVYYSSLPGEQATAEAMGKQFSMRVQPRFPGIASASPGVIVILTNDFKGPH